jgi:HD superfamily phosphohydrolase
MDERGVPASKIVVNKTSKIDVDKMDYLARDCHGLSMQSDFDYLRYIQNCRVMIVDDAGTRVDFVSYLYIWNNQR